MKRVIVLGGYGQVGRRCVRELMETTRAHLGIAGRNYQLAERAAGPLGERAFPLYVNAGDVRTLRDTLDGASVLVACSAGPPLAALGRALECGVPFIGVTSFPLDAHERGAVAERAWQARIPVVLGCGAIPGLPGVVADSLVRRFDALDEIRVASTGPWLGTQSARRDVEAVRAHASIRRGRRVPRTWQFPAPVGRRRVRPAAAPDLDGFSDQHCVEHVTVLELARGGLRERLAPPPSGFALTGEAFLDTGARHPVARVELAAADAADAAAVTAAAVARAVLAGHAPAGLLQAREALNPGALLDAVSKRGLEVSTEVSA